MQTCFSEFQSKSILKCPKFETRCLAPASRIEAPGPSYPWRPRRRLWTAGTLPPRHGHFPSRSAAAFGLRRLFSGNPSAAVGFRRTTARRPMRRGDDGSCGQLSSMPVQPTNEWWMFWTQQLQTVQSEIYSHTITNTSNKFHGILFPRNYLQWNAVYSLMV